MNKHDKELRNQPSEIDDCCMTAPTLNNVYIVGKRKPGTEPTEEERRENARRIAQAIKNVARYKKV